MTRNTRILSKYAMAKNRRQAAHHAQEQHYLELISIPEDESISFTVNGNKTTTTTWQTKIDPQQEDLDMSIALTNRARLDVGEFPLKHSEFLEGLAHIHAQRMAAVGRVRHAVKNVETLQSLLASDHVASNVQRGFSIQEMHSQTMKDYPANRANMLSSRFNEYGVGIAWGDDDYLYCCQYFRSKSF